MQIEEAHLYVEKYDRKSHELWLDFIQEEEFLFFRNLGDYTPGMLLRTDIHNPTMLLVHDCFPERRLKEGMMITVPMNELMNFRRQRAELEGEYSRQDEYKPALIFNEIHNGVHFAKMIDAKGTAVSKKIPTEFKDSIQPSWDGSPCALEYLGDNFELCIWNVGQGSTNSISDKLNLTLFDFGASCYYSRNDLKKIIEDHKAVLSGTKRISLIISHWDTDHFNLLTAVEDSFLKDICCVFSPPTVITMTAKQVAARIRKNCRYRVGITPPRMVYAHKCGLCKKYSSAKYALFTGEAAKSKNLSGLLLIVYNNAGSAILAADHSNYQVWDIAYKHILKLNPDKPLHIVVPHHGGNCGKTPVQTSRHPGVAAVSVGSNTHGHPVNSVITEYRNANYHVVRTDRRYQDIVISF